MMVSIKLWSCYFGVINQIFDTIIIATQVIYIKLFLGLYEHQLWILMLLFWIIDCFCTCSMFLLCTFCVVSTCCSCEHRGCGLSHAYTFIMNLYIILLGKRYILKEHFQYCSILRKLLHQRGLYRRLTQTPAVSSTTVLGLGVETRLVWADYMYTLGVVFQCVLWCLSTLRWSI